MTTRFVVQIRLTKSKWVSLAEYRTHKDALEDARNRAGETYPLRVVRVMTKVIFESKS